MSSRRALQLSEDCKYHPWLSTPDNAIAMIAHVPGLPAAALRIPKVSLACLTGALQLQLADEGLAGRKGHVGIAVKLIISDTVPYKVALQHTQDTPRLCWCPQRVTPTTNTAHS